MTSKLDIIKAKAASKSQSLKVKEKESFGDSAEIAAQRTIDYLEEFNQEGFDAVLTTVYSLFETTAGTEKDLYTKKANEKSNFTIAQTVRGQLSKKVDVTKKSIKNLLSLESESPYGVFTPLLECDYSDFIISKLGFKISDNMRFFDIEVPEHLMKVYRKAFDHYINMVKMINSAQFDPGHANLDGETNVGDLGIMRYEITHESLTGRTGWPVAILRKQTVGSSILGDDYVNSLGLSERQLAKVQEASMHGMTLIFGETGSGKTTLMRYMGQHRLDEKRNLIIIEDTAELGIKVPLSFTTNETYTISKLFKAALRQNPSGIMIGESRTDEIVDIMEAALSTDLAISTIHANTLPRALQRLIQMASPRHMPRTDLEQLIKVSITNFIFIEKRKVKGFWTNGNDYNKNIFEMYEEVK